jgi:phenylalanyl-tRNA synthetase beta chain
MCQLIRGVKVAPSPNWLQSRLLAIGSRPINNVVDVTNFVLYEWGQPLHAFDYRMLKGGRIVVRRMASNESIKLLNGKVVDGRQSPLVIADAERPVALAGIMGGGDAETNEATVDVLLEAAYFDPVNIRKTVRSIDLGLEAGGTESSYRFERGTDPNTMLVGALHRASSLIAELSGGHVAGPPSDVYPQKRERRSFSLTTDMASGCLGTLISKDTIRESLRRLEMECSDDLVVKVPTWRVDVNDPVVLIEDVARHIDYDTIPTQPSATKPTIGIRCTPDRLRQVVVQHLIASGYLESRNPSLENPDAGAVLGSHGAGPIALLNPANREMSVVRRSLLPGLLKSAERNLRRGTTSVRLFEIDRVFWLEENQPKERWMAAGVAGGAVQEYDWRSGGAKLDFHHLKGRSKGCSTRLPRDRARIDRWIEPRILRTAPRRSSRVMSQSGASANWSKGWSIPARCR